MPEVLHTDVPSVIKQDFAEIARRHNRSLAGELRQAVAMWVRAHGPADESAGLRDAIQDDQREKRNGTGK